MSDANIPGFTPANPFGAFQQGYGIGQAIGANRDAKIAAEQERLRMAEQQRLFDTWMAPGSTMDDFLAFYNYLPEEQRESAMAGYEARTLEQEKTALAESASLLSAIRTGNIPVAQDMLTTAAQAARNEGREAEARQLEGFVRLMNTPEGAKTVETGLMTQIMGMQGGADIIDNMETLQGVQFAAEDQQLKLIETAKELGLSQEETTTAENAARIAGHDIIMEMLQYSPVSAGGEGLTENEKLDLTLKLYDRYQKRASGWQDADERYRNLINSASDGTGPGDLALIFQFMKLLDEGSVVRESEYAAASNTGDLFQRLQNWYAKLQEGDTLQPEQRANFVRLAGEYYRAAQQEEQRARDDLSTMVNNRGLNPQEVFGTMTGQELMGEDDWGVQQAKTQLSIMGIPESELSDFNSVIELEKAFPDAFRALGNPVKSEAL